MKLNIGSGHKRIDGFLNIDNDSLVSPDYVVNLEAGKLPFDDSCVSEVIASHILEHIGSGYIPLMKEIYRVSEPNAIVHVVFPHHMSTWFSDDPTHVRPLTANQFKLFSKKYIQYHIENFGSSNGIAIKEDVDFEILEQHMKPFPKWEERFAKMTNEEIQEVADSQYNVFYEVYLKLVVIKE